mgnify:CR=1 FL=1
MTIDKTPYAIPSGMASKKAIIIAAIVVIVAVIAVGAAAGGGGEDSADIRYDYTLSFAEQIGEGLLPYIPDEGYVFLVVDYTLTNDWDENITTNSFFQKFTAELDGIIYQFDTWVSSGMPGHETVQVAPGGTVTDCVVIQVPVGHDITDFTIGYEYDEYGVTVAFDDTLM